MKYIEFIRSNKNLTLFGSMLTFHSGFGQTFFISLFVPFFLLEFGLNNTTFGLVYSSATLGSAVLLMSTGQLIDRYDLKWYSGAVAIGFAISAALMAISFSFWILLPALIGLRLFGQGLTMHTAQATMARYFETLRGKALSVSSLGMPLGEATLPSLFAFLITIVGWRNSWLIVGALCLFFLLPVLILSLRNIETNPARLATANNGMSDKTIIWNRRKVLKDARFYFMLPATLLTPFMLTGLFLFQLTLAGYKGWSIEIIAAAFIAFAGARVIFSLVVGPLIDRYSATKIFPWMLSPHLAGLITLWLLDLPAAAFLYMGLIGITEGLAGSVKTSIWAELYGTKTIGAIRSMITTFMIISTAISPLLFGWLLDAGYGFDFILPAAIVLTITVILLAFGVNKSPPVLEG